MSVFQQTWYQWKAESPNFDITEIYFIYVSKFRCEQVNTQVNY